MCHPLQLEMAFLITCFEGVSGICSFMMKIHENPKEPCASDYEKKSITCDMATVISTQCPNFEEVSQWSALLMAQVASQQSQQTLVHCTARSNTFIFRNFKSSNFKTQDFSHAEIRIPHNLVCC